MTGRRWVLFCGALAVCAATGSAELGHQAAADGTKTKAKADEPATAQSPITMSPAELTWGIDKPKVIAIYDKVIDDDFKDRYQKVQPGPDMEALDAEVKAQKDAFRKSLVTLDQTTSALDTTPLRSEYTFGNREEVMRITRAQMVRDFFFIPGHLWKIVDELPLGDGARWGRDYAAALGNVALAYGVPGRARNADAEKGRPFVESDWKDATSIARAVDWRNGSFALVFEDATTVARLSVLRTAKQPALAKPADKAPAR